MSDSLLKQLEWSANPCIEEFELLGCLRGEHQITLFIIHAAREHHGRFDLLGAFVPDADERSITYDSIDQAKAAAGLYLSSWMQRRLDDFAKFQNEEDIEENPECDGHLMHLTETIKDYFDAQKKEGVFVSPRDITMALMDVICSHTCRTREKSLSVSVIIHQTCLGLASCMMRWYVTYTQKEAKTQPGG